MGIKSIRVKNLLSFDDVLISNIRDINCVIGQNNAGKSNLLNLINYYYAKMEGKKVLPPELHNSYSNSGSISIVFDTTRIKQIVTSRQRNSPYQKHIYNTLFKGDNFWDLILIHSTNKAEKSSIELTLTINKDDSIRWSNKNKDVREVLSRIFPFFSIDTRKIDLYDWSKLWNLISQLKFINTKKLKRKELIEFIDSNVSKKSSSYKDYVEKIEKITRTSAYSYQEKVLNYVKVGLEGHTFNIDGEDLKFQSDGTNSHKYLELFLNLLIALTRREFITPTVYIDEPEIGLHPKRNEELIYKLYEIYQSFKKTKKEKEKGKYSTPYPNIIMSTHSPNIVKYIVRLFKDNDEHQILHFSKFNSGSTNIRVLNSHYKDARFLNVFSDNEARLFFSHFILFVEGETELEVFGNLKLADKYPSLRKIDVYRANEVMLRPINPSFSNLSIPYLVLYDADVLVETDFTNGSLAYKKGKINLFDLHKKYKRSYYGSDLYYAKRELNRILKQEGRPKTLNPAKTDFSIFNYQSFIDKLNKNILSKNNTMVTATTIEGSLINNNSINIFYKWLVHEVFEHIQVGGTGDVCQTISRFMALFQSGMSLKQVFSGIFKTPHFNGELSIPERRFSKLVKIRYINKIKRELITSGFSSDEMVVIFRLVFEGKTNTLVSKKNDNYVHIASNIKDMVIKVKEEYLDKFPHETSKTGGWVTSFLSFSIYYIETVKCKNGESNFKSEFRKTFPELDDIIKKVSFSIE